jgi:hypothetical protein
MADIPFGNLIAGAPSAGLSFEDLVPAAQAAAPAFEDLVPPPDAAASAQVARDVAAARTKQSVMPAEGRKEVEMPLAALGGEALKGIPIAGHFMPQTDTMTQFETEHPRRAAAARMVGGMAASAPAFAAAGPGLVANALVGGGLNAADTYAGGGSGQDTIRSGAFGAGGGILGALFNKIPRIITPNPIPSERQAMIDFLQKKGVNSLTAGQKTGNEALQYAESAAKVHQGDMGKMQEDFNRQFTGAALDKGGTKATNTSGDTMKRMNDDIGGEFNRLTGSTELPFDPGLQNNLLGSVSNYARNTNASLLSPVPENIMNDASAMAAAQGGKLTGVQYQKLRSDLGRMASSTTDPNAANVMSKMRHHLDNAMEQHLANVAPHEVGAFKNVRDRYRNMLILEKAATGPGSNTQLGYISPTALRTAAKSVVGTREAAQGANDLYELGRSGEAIAKPLPNSGTAQRAAALEGSSLAYILGGEALGHTMGMPPSTGALAAAAGGPLVGHMLRKGMQHWQAETAMNSVMQRYYANQAMPGEFQMPPAAQAAINYLSRKPAQ